MASNLCNAAERITKKGAASEGWTSVAPRGFVLFAEPLVPDLVAFEIYARCRREVCDTISRPIYGFREKSWIAMDPPLSPPRSSSPGWETTKTFLLRFSFVRGTRLYGDTRRRYPRRPSIKSIFPPKLKLQLNCRFGLLPSLFLDCVRAFQYLFNFCLSFYCRFYGAVNNCLVTIVSSLKVVLTS